MATRLQERFLKSRIFRSIMQAELTAEGFPPEAYNRCYVDCMREIFQDMTEAEIKKYLYAFLQSYDITDQEREEIRELLSMAETSLTEKQAQLMQKWLYG